jgi:hypothetical protein
VKWSAARTFLLAHAGYKLQTYSPDFMETFNPIGYDTSLAVQVNKAPLLGGSYEIQAKFFCANIFACYPDPRATLDQFNRTVAAIQ